MSAPAGYLLLHGTPLTPAVWSGVGAALVAGGRVLTPPVELTAADADDRSGDEALADRIAAALPAGGLHVVGHSFGGQVAIDLALRHPGRVTRVTLLCTRDSPFPGFVAAAESLRAGHPPDVEAALQRWFRPAELVARGPLVDYAERCLREADRLVWAQALASIARFDRTAETPSIAVPTRVVAAEFDGVSTVEAMTAMADRIPGSTLTVLAGAAHLSPFLRPAELATTITQ